MRCAFGVGVAIFLFLLLVSLQNADPVKLRFYTWVSWEVPLIFLVLIVFAVITMLDSVHFRRALANAPTAAAGTATSFVSTLASQELIRVVERDSALWPYAAYRAGLAGTVLANLWRKRRAPRPRFVSGNGRPEGYSPTPPKEGIPA
jgi:hypothetical protein